nr:Imm52 family immunity protein [Cupriavidus sp. WGlv3]
MVHGCQGLERSGKDLAPVSRYRRYTEVCSWFSDRPAVGWMLYLPMLLTEQQIPEARALISVPDEDNKRVGTIVVSVTDTPFSGTDPEHVRAANAIEVRLVDQDLLPRYIDL